LFYFNFYVDSRLSPCVSLLSLLLWFSLPDDEHMRHAAPNRVHEGGGLRAQASRGAVGMRTFMLLSLIFLDWPTTTFPTDLHT